MSKSIIGLSTPKFCPKISRQLRRKHRSKCEKDIRTWIRNRTSWIDYGKQITNKDGEKHPIHCNKNDEVERFYFQLQTGIGRPRMGRMNNRMFDLHLSKKQTYYCAGSHGSKSSLTLVNIDIDCKKFGSLEGAIAFAEYLKQSVFPNMYFEVSTNGNGVHGYIVLCKNGYDERLINDLLLYYLDPYLKQLLRDSDFDVENVEIKGTAPMFDWGDQKFELCNYKSGVLAKIPRVNTPERISKLKNTTYVHACDLLNLDTPKSKSKESKNQNLSLSGTGVPIKQEDLDDFHLYLEIANELIGDEPLKTSDRHVVRPVDVACFLLLGKCFTENMNKDGTMPRERFKSVQERLFANNFVARAFNGKRFKVIRDKLTSYGLIDWEDATFRISTEFDKNGNGLNGKACKWKFSEDMMGMLDFGVGDIEKGESIFRDTSKNSMKMSVSDFIQIIKEGHQASEITIPLLIFEDYDYQAAALLVDKVVSSWSPPKLAA